ncbi:hypothetical protein EDD37DRAFT_565077 [Exophiala viscosa]|uniref:uncharacterized protein n=1 Tax=Exophiala viscosa TaxID=2486360 RepID=UPI00219A3A4E|nr:hypothetical protein EDD37DRAFT_565077 [Exophiala viscosa]
MDKFLATKCPVTRNGCHLVTRYILSQPNILRTNGITETVFELRDLTIRMVDVGGPRSAHKKWDPSANQMGEALVLFDSLVNGTWFKDKPIILFLNKIGLFRKKLCRSDCRLWAGASSPTICPRWLRGDRSRPFP